MFFVSDAMAAGEAAAQVGGMEGFLMQVVPLVVIFAVFWFFLIRPQQKRNKEHKAMLESLGKGSYVITSGGLLGRIVDLEGDILVIDLGETKVRMPRGFVSGTYDPKAVNKTAEAAAPAENK